ncbi:MAG: hypothetical protein GXY45_10525 [Ramlibacter sp.]|nr:hypothetical protein [Ramlibacter sp.]
MHDIDNILDERGSRYGKFIDQAKISQSLQATLRHANNSWDKMQPDQREALEMIACKLGRIVNGDPDYIDSWDDIAGYAKLVADRLRGVVR